MWAKREYIAHIPPALDHSELNMLSLRENHVVR